MNYDYKNNINYILMQEELNNCLTKNYIQKSEERIKTLNN